MTSRFARLIRGWRLDRNPLRRPSDRAEAVIVFWLLVAFAVIAPLTARAAAAWAHAVAEHTRVSALATRYEVTAITLEKAPPPRRTLMTQPQVDAAWIAPDGRHRTGQVQVPAGTQQGSSERIWVDGAGDPVAPPLPAAKVAGLADRAACAAIALLIGLFLITVSVIKRVIDRKRLAAWDAEWTVTGPRWTRQP